MEARSRYRGYVARFDASGHALSARAIMPASTNVWGWRLESRGAHGLILGGRFFYSLDVEGLGRVSAGQWGDAFIATIEAP